MKQMVSPFQAATGTVPIRISVVIPHLNQPALRDRGLRSLRRGAHRPDEITILATGAPICPGAVCGASPDLRLLPERESGPGPARTKGGAKSSGDVPAFMDAGSRLGAARPADEAPHPICGRDEGLPSRMRDIFQDVEDRGPARRADPGYGP